MVGAQAPRPTETFSSKTWNIFHMITTFVILAITIVLFIWGKPRADIAALLSLLALYLSGIITVGQALSGFADSAVIMIAALFVVGEGLTHTGVTAWLGAKMMTLSGKRPAPLMLWMMGIGAALSGFMSNTAAVAALMPAVVTASWGVGSIPAKFLIPLSFAAITGGLLTLMGTPPNVVASEALVSAGYAPLGFFDFAWVGVPLVGVVMLYMVTFGQKLLPKTTQGSKPLDLDTSMSELADSYSLHGKLFRLRVREQSPLVGKTLAEAAIGRDREISVLRIERSNGHANSPTTPINIAEQGEHSEVAAMRQEHDAKQPKAPFPLDRFRTTHSVIIPNGQTRLQVDDELLVRATPEIVERAQVDFNFGVMPIDEATEPLSRALLSREIGLAEVLITPRSELIGKTLADSRFAEQYRVHVIGVRRHDQIAKRQRVKLDFGDSLLVRGNWEDIQRLVEDQYNFVVVGSPRAMEEQVTSLSNQAWLALGAVAVMVILMITGAVPTVIATLIAAGIIVLGGAISNEQLYRSISWQSIVLIASMIPMSVALQVSGGGEFLVTLLVEKLGSISPYLLMAGIFLVTSTLSQVISNTASTVLVAPLALQAALALGVSPYPMIMMVVVGASTAFLTPVGTPTNLLVMAPGGYQFRHYTIVGLPLFFLFFAIALVIVPLVWAL